MEKIKIRWGNQRIGLQGWSQWTPLSSPGDSLGNACPPHTRRNNQAPHRSITPLPTSPAGPTLLLGLPTVKVGVNLPNVRDTPPQPKTGWMSSGSSQCKGQHHQPPLLKQVLSRGDGQDANWWHPCSSPYLMLLSRKRGHSFSWGTGD